MKRNMVENCGNMSVISISFSIFIFTILPMKKRNRKKDSGVDDIRDVGKCGLHLNRSICMRSR